ncbi:MAG: hypothetical protein K2N75_00010 [Helicobacter sp.]|uniref:hypothetical protein n=1 Tax=Helicobacter sp. TaxID=218 RepID=UPI0023C6A209|nr:hypothetical protein [Helicobacter sp.]MDE5925636.1 hypothetical protein [Helicobacter sp.]MDE7174431.1 hypothetical protein [Helicobacter sp.]
MKNVSEVLSHLFSTPCYQKYYEVSQLNQFIRLLPLSIKGGIAFGYIKNDILFLALKHPAFKQEFYHKISLLKQLLKTYQKEKSSLTNVQDIQYFVTYNAYHKEVELRQENEVAQCYGELARGNFTNYAKDAEIFEIFENIRQAILQNQEKCL